MILAAEQRGYGNRYRGRSTSKGLLQSAKIISLIRYIQFEYLDAGLPAMTTAIASLSTSCRRWPEAGLDAVEAACAEALAARLFGRDVVLNLLERQRDAALPRPVATPAALTLAIEPAADCARYDRLRHPSAAQEAYRGAA